MIKRHRQIDNNTIKKIREFLKYESNGTLRWLKNPCPNVKAGYRAGRRHVNGHIELGFDKKTYMAHHIVWIFHYGTMPTQEIMHINGNKSDNRIENLQVFQR